MMHVGPYHVNAEWDPEAGVFVAWSDDVPGLATGADSFEALVEKLRVVIPELLEANGLLAASEEITFSLVVERTEHLRSAA